MQKYTRQAIDQYLKTLYSACRLPVSYIENGVWIKGFGLYAEMSENGICNPYVSDPDLASHLFSEDENSVYLRSEPEDPEIYYGIFMIGHHTAVVLGPVSLRALRHTQRHAYIRRHNISNYRDFTIPAAQTDQVWSVLSLLSGQFAKELPLPVVESEIRYPSDEVSFLLRQSRQYQMLYSDEDLQHHPYSLEERMMSFVTAGDLEAVRDLISENPLTGYTVGKVAASSQKQAEYTSVVGVSLIVRAAIQGGMNPYDAYALNDLYLQRIESADSEEKRDRILLEALFHITDEVRRAKERSMQSIHIQKVRSYIARHISQRLTQSEIAEYVGLSPAYLSSLFSRTEHISIKEYILQMYLLFDSDETYGIHMDEIDDELCLCLDRSRKPQLFFPNSFASERAG